MKIFPDQETLENYQDYHFSDIISTLMVEAIIGDSSWLIGNTTHELHMQEIVPGPEGIKILRAQALYFLKQIQKALPDLKGEYKEFYEFMYNDYKTNGMPMPMMDEKILDGTEL